MIEFFSKKLKELRTIANISQRELANDLNVDQSTVGKWESSIAYPQIEMLLKIANYFKVTPNDLLGY